MPELILYYVLFSSGLNLFYTLYHYVYYTSLRKLYKFSDLKNLIYSQDMIHNGSNTRCLYTLTNVVTSKMNTEF
jgi:hypothetical protein